MDGQNDRKAEMEAHAIRARGNLRRMLVNNEPMIWPNGGIGGSRK
jgi:hypothetical protein